MENKLRRIQIRRGLNSQRTKVLYEEGEPVYLVDKQRVYIGDNQTFGGILASNINFIENDKIIPKRSVETDIIIDKTNKNGYILTKNDELIEVFSPTTCCEYVQTELDKLKLYVDEIYDEYFNEEKALITDSLTAINADYGDFLRPDKI